MPPVKKQSRPRIDAIIRHIKAGSYDEEMEQLKGAIDERNRARQEAVLKVVKQVFGAKATVEIDPDPDGQQNPAPRPTARRQRPGTPPQDHQDPELDAAEQAALARERELEAEMNGAAGEGEDDGIISHSPIIGSVET